MTLYTKVFRNVRNTKRICEMSVVDVDRIECTNENLSEKRYLPFMSSSDITKTKTQDTQTVAKRGENEYYDTFLAGKELSNVVKNITSSFEVDACYISIYGDYGGVVLASSGVEKENIPNHDKLLGYSTLSNGVSIYPDGDNDERFMFTQILKGIETSWAIGIPIKNSSGKQIGAICCVRTQNSDMIELGKDDNMVDDFKSVAETVSKMLDSYRY